MNFIQKLQCNYIVMNIVFSKYILNPNIKLIPSVLCSSMDKYNNVVTQKYIYTKYYIGTAVDELCSSPMNIQFPANYKTLTLDGRYMERRKGTITTAALYFHIGGWCCGGEGQFSPMIKFIYRNKIFYVGRGIVEDSQKRAILIGGIPKEQYLSTSLRDSLSHYKVHPTEYLYNKENKVIANAILTKFIPYLKSKFYSIDIDMDTVISKAEADDLFITMDTSVFTDTERLKQETLETLNTLLECIYNPTYDITVPDGIISVESDSGKQRILKLAAKTNWNTLHTNLKSFYIENS